jgi:hypothetical protein
MADLLPSFLKKKRFIRHFSSYLSDHEWSCIVAAGSPDEVLTELYRYVLLMCMNTFRINQRFRYGLLHQSTTQLVELDSRNKSVCLRVPSPSDYLQT